MEFNERNDYYIEVDLIRTKGFIPSILLQLLNHTKFVMESDRSYIRNLNISQLEKEIKITRKTISKQIGLLGELGKVYYEGGILYIKDAEPNYCRIESWQKDAIINIRNKTAQRLALYHINTCNIYGCEHAKTISEICKYMDLSFVNREEILKYHKEIEESGLIEIKKFDAGNQYLNNRYILGG